MNINYDAAKDTLCKNILIYGYCKFENKGCAFSHSTSALPASPPPASGQTQQSQSETPATSTPSSSNLTAAPKKKFNFNTPSFQPSSTSVNTITNKFSALSPKLDSIPSFVPSALAEEQQPQPPSTNSGKKFNPSASVFLPSYEQTPPPPLNQQSPAPINNPYAAPNGATTPLSNNVDMFYSQGANGPTQTQPSNNFPLNYHLYAPAPPPRLTIPLPPHETNSYDMFIPNDLREQLLKKNEATLVTLNVRGNLPDSVNVYHSLTPLEMESVSKVWNVNTMTYKVFSNTDGNAYVLKRIDYESLIDIETKLPFKTIKKWLLIDNNNIVKLHDCFTTMSFGNTSQLCIVYDYYPNALTLAEQHIHRKLGTKIEPITEEVIWSYVIQIINALDSIHKEGLAARESLNLSKIIVVSKNRIKLSAVGISDILSFENHDKYEQFQKEDIKRVGYLILELSLLLLPQSMRAGDLSTILARLKLMLSAELFDLMLKLTSEAEVTLDDITEKYLAKRMLKMVNNLEESGDFLQNQLTNEIENARLFRLISKINFIIDHPNLNWKENERIHLIKLFHNYIFHQIDTSGKPVIDLSRVLVKLNKLDCGIDERFMLITRDEKLSILVSYKELRDLINSAFRELTK